MLADSQESLMGAVEVKWRYLEDTAQEYALSATAQHILLTGGRGWGKTECQLMRFRKNVGKGYGSHWRGIIFDREYKNLDDLVMKSKRLFYGMDDGAVFLASGAEFKWRWPSGEELLFRVAKSLDDYWSYHGHEYAFIGWNELTKYADNKLFLKMMSINRTGFDPVEHTPRKAMMGHNGGPPLDHKDLPYDTADGKPLPEIPLEVCCTCNPYGPGHNWVKRRFIDPAPYGKIVTTTAVVFDPKTKQDVPVDRTQVTIFGSFRENSYLSKEYIAGLYEETDENVLKAWLKGDWDIVAGGALDDLWRRNVHILPRFPIPAGWRIDRALDWGSSEPFSVGWFAETNGEDVDVTMPDGTTRTFMFPAGTLIQIAEWYGTKEIGSNIGIKLGPKDLAEGIKEREKYFLEKGLIPKKPSPGPADNQIANVNDTETETIEKRMNDAGIYWEKSDKSKGSRKQGLQLIRDRLEASVNGEGPGLYFMVNCVASISTIPMLPRNENDMDDVDTDAEDHPYDQVRYRVLKGNNRTATVIHANFAR